jgi:hypothetical protein
VLSAIAGRAHAECVDGTVMACTVGGISGTRECEGGAWSPCMGPDGLPIPVPEPLKAPARTARTSTSITLKNFNQPPGQYKLQHQTNGVWTTLATLAPNASFVHNGLQPDSRHCYRFSVVTVGTSSGTCGYTPEASGWPAWRIQLELQTANIGDAGSNNAVSVSLTENDTNFTWLDYGIQDFKRNSTQIYDLNLNAVDLRSDIHQIKIHTYGTDGWCLDRMRLIVNGVSVYEQDFDVQPSGCLWLDNDDGHQPILFVSHETIRGDHDSLWNAYAQPQRFLLTGTPSDLTATLRIDGPELESRIEALVGHHLHGEEAYWGGLEGLRFVEAEAASSPDSVHFDLDLKAFVPVLPNPDLDVDFDLKFTARCSLDQTRAVVTLDVENLQSDADFDWWAELLANAFSCATGQPDCTDFAENTIEARLEKAFGSIALPVSTTPIQQGYRCLGAGVEVSPNGTVRLLFHVAPALTNQTGPIH